MRLTVCCCLAAVQAVRAELDVTAKDLAEARASLDSTTKDLTEARASLDSAGQAQQQLQLDIASATKLRDESSGGACKVYAW